MRPVTVPAVCFGVQCDRLGRGKTRHDHPVQITSDQFASQRESEIAILRLSRPSAQTNPHLTRKSAQGGTLCHGASASENRIGGGGEISSIGVASPE